MMLIISLSLGNGFLIFLLVCAVVSISIAIPLTIIRKKYRKFVLLHSIALKQLREINNKYEFLDVANFDMVHSYDNENMYDDISCEDYLTYELVYLQSEVGYAIEDALENKRMFQLYKNEINRTCVMDRYDTTDLLRNRNRLIKFEEELFDKNIKIPIVELTIVVKLRLTNINGAYRRSKYYEFSSNEIKEIIKGLNQKRGKFYLNNDIWQSICRVERGKVTNKMRFAIYQRDGYRCRKCGRRTDDLEVDHIIPISKGGKSTFDNLQTLCHRCNVRKGDKIE